VDLVSNRSVSSRLMSARQVDLALGVLIAVAVLSGLTSWAAGDRWNGWFALIHGTAGLALLLLLPAKLRGSVRTGLRRGRSSRWFSLAFGLIVVGAVTLGLLHSTGLWFGAGPWTALWTHELLGFSSIPLLAWHWLSRPARPRLIDVDRRGVLGFGLAGVVALGVHIIQRPLATAVGLAGGRRRATGSHELASHNPAGMPSVIWLNDRRPASTEAATWPLSIGGRRVTIDELRAMAEPVTAILDCTGGWWSEQSWDAVPLSALLPESSGRSFVVTSHTGYRRRFPMAAAGSLHLAVGYGGVPLRPGHGAPVRLIVPGRRGPEWVKWVTDVTIDDRPWWLQPPLPLS